MIAVSSSGRSFRALARYLVHGRSGQEHDRIEWSTGRNLPTSEPEIAAKIMRATAAQSTRVELPVYHLTISFDPRDRDRLSRATMERVADRVLDRLGLAEHQAVIVAHRDREHPHVHIMLNRVHPDTGRAWERWQDHLTIQAVLREEERALGLTIVPGRLAAVDGLAMPERTGVTSGERRHAARTGEPIFADRVRAHLADYRVAVSWRDLEAQLALDGLRLEPRGQGLVITDGTHYARASRVARELSLRQLEARFGIAYADREHEPPVPPAVAQLARELRAMDRSAGEAAHAYTTRLATSRARTQLATMEAAIARARRASAAFDEGLAAVYRDPVAARRAFEARAGVVGVARAAQEFIDAPERFGALRTQGRFRALGADLLPTTARARAEAAALPALAQAAADAQRGAPTPTDVEMVRAALRQTRRAHEAVQVDRARHTTPSALEAAIARGVAGLETEGQQRLRRLVTAAQFQVALRLRDTVRDVLLGRDDQGRSRA